MAIKDWPADDRPREKLLRRGPSALTDAELLAIFLRTGTPGKSAVDLARELLDHFGSLKDLLSADQQQFCQGHGLGEVKYTQLQAVMEMAKRHFKEAFFFSRLNVVQQLLRNFFTISFMSGCLPMLGFQLVI